MISVARRTQPVFVVATLDNNLIFRQPIYLPYIQHECRFARATLGYTIVNVRIAIGVLHYLMAGIVQIPYQFLRCIRFGFALADRYAKNVVFVGCSIVPELISQD